LRSSLLLAESSSHLLRFPALACRTKKSGMQRKSSEAMRQTG
jgi:hypothetical protein